jgi:hypothetical protein
MVPMLVALEANNPELACIERARDATVLSEPEQENLCRGAASAAPVDCYREAIDETPLSDEVAIALCRCADSTQPVSCFREAREQRPDALREAIRVCSPTSVRNLTGDCRALEPR